MKHRHFFLKILFLIMFCGGAYSALSQSVTGRIYLDTAIWKPTAYLSKIDDLSQLHSISFNNIIDSAMVVNHTFSLPTDQLEAQDGFYRIHVSKKEDPPASLIIGGKDQNHFFLIASQGVNIDIMTSPGPHLLYNLRIFGYAPNNRLMEINSITGLLDTLNFFGTAFSREYVNDAVLERLRHYADTCSSRIISDYALQLAGEGTQKVRYLWIWIFLVVVILLVFVWPRIMKKKRPVSLAVTKLTIQERKIYQLLREGKTNKEIAEECVISVSTVKSHVNSIYSKLGVGSRTEIMDN